MQEVQSREKSMVLGGTRTQETNFGRFFGSWFSRHLVSKVKEKKMSWSKIHYRHVSVSMEYDVSNGMKWWLAIKKSDLERKTFVEVKADFAAMRSRAWP